MLSQRMRIIITIAGISLIWVLFLGLVRLRGDAGDTSDSVTPTLALGPSVTSEPAGETGLPPTETPTSPPTPTPTPQGMPTPTFTPVMGTTPTTESAGETPTLLVLDATPSPESVTNEPVNTPVAGPTEVAFAGDTAVVGSEVISSGELTVSDLGLGTVDASAPAELMVGESGTVRLEIAPLFDPEDVQVEIYVTVTAIDEPVEVLNFYGDLRLYSIMTARLSAPGFDVQSAMRDAQRLSSAAPALWTWDITAREAGRRSVTISVSVPTVIDGEIINIETSPLRTIAFTINVTAPPQPPPTPTPGPFGRTASGNLVGPLIIAIFLSIAGAISGFIWSRMADDDGDTFNISIAGDVSGDVNVAGDDIINAGDTDDEQGA